ncbi:MAG: sigma D regulator [Psychrobium sp.]
MLEKVKQARQQWGGSNLLIDTWLTKRQELIVTYCQIAGIPPYEENAHQLPKDEEISEFCTRLVDYVSTGHFEVYREVVSACEVHGESSILHIDELIPQISVSTEMTLEFTEKYAENEHTFDRFDTHLSTLIEGLEQRFELEDQLLSNLHEKHSSTVS